jgi:hypothetical protein
MRTRIRLPSVLATVALLLITVSSFAQLPPLTTPQASQKAMVEQTVGLTDITITYHRPGVNGRKIWGGLVPYGDVWRAGANENTTIAFTSPVTVEAQKLAAGTYGLHMIPTEGAWTIIFSNMATAWGSFSYDAKEDAVRVTVTPQQNDMTERLQYTFDEPTDKNVTVSLRWEKLRVPFRVEVDTPNVVLTNIRKELRGLPRFGWQGWNQAATYALRNGGDLDEAMQWADASINLQPTFQNLRTKAAIAEKKGDAKTAADLRARAMSIATEVDINAYGYGLLGEKKYDEAIQTFTKNVTDHPQSWNVYDSLADAYAAKGDKAKAMQNYNRARSLTTDDAQRKRIDAAIKKLNAS